MMNDIASSGGTRTGEGRRPDGEIPVHIDLPLDPKSVGIPGQKVLRWGLMIVILLAGLAAVAVLLLADSLGYDLWSLMSSTGAGSP